MPITRLALMIVLASALNIPTVRADTKLYVYVIDLTTANSDKGMPTDFVNFIEPIIKKKHREVEIRIATETGGKCPEKSKTLCDVVSLTQRDKTFPLVINTTKRDQNHGTVKPIWECHKYEKDKICWENAFNQWAFGIKRHHENFHKFTADLGLGR